MKNTTFGNSAFPSQGESNNSEFNSDTASFDLSEHLSTCICAACAENERLRDDTGRNVVQSDGDTSSAAARTSLQTMSDFLETGFWGNSTGLRHNLGSTGRDANDGILHYNVSGFSELQYGGGSDANGVRVARADLIRDAFAVYESVLGIDFVETTSSDSSVVDFFFSDNKGGAYAGSTLYSDGTINYSYINIARSWSGGSSDYDSYALQTVFHEIGHAMGLGHQGNYNGSGGYSADAQFELDSWQATMMSYFSQDANTAIDASYEFLQTPMVVDWLALDSIYGKFGYGVENAFLGDTVYGFGTNISTDESAIWNSYSEYADRTASTIIDAGGIDTLNFSGYDADQRIDLTVQSASQTYQDSSDIGGRVGNLTLAVGTVIENAIGGSGDDIFIGNAADNVFDGGEGFDTVVYNSIYDDYYFSLIGDAIEVVGEGIDLILDTVESFRFSDITHSFQTIADLVSANMAPVAVDDFATVGENAALTLDVVFNDMDADGDVLSVTMVDGQSVQTGDTVILGSGASITLDDDGTLNYRQNGAFTALNGNETAMETFGYTVSDVHGDAATATVSVTIEGETAVMAGPIGQSGTVSVVQQNSTQWHQVTFDAEIHDAVVVMGPMTFNGGQPATTRVRNVTDTGFEFQIDEWNYLDGYHIREDIGWLAMSEGSHLFGDGQTIVAGTRHIGTDFSNVTFGERLDDAVVLTEVSSVNGVDAVTTRIRKVDSDGFELRLQEEEAGGPHFREVVSWIAIEAGNDAGLDVFLTANQLSHTADSFVFNTSFDSSPVLLADMQSFNGPDTATVRLRALDDTGVSLFVEEEGSRDAERRHVNETAGYVALEEGLIFADQMFL